ncbi:DUF6183 family protein [Streptosporangium amethystogenes]|uniref:DUF6183 family protein n=1 Tax=Streptosporangium amethystogenes TaxID=2002 RepID=UPI0004C749F1|nr:DUF6183 family protein [Streptosporangium amethystogenes]
MISHGLVDGPHGPIMSRVPGDTGSLAELVRDHYTGERRLREVRDLAALLAESRRVHHLLPLFGCAPAEPDTWAELIACLAQELVVRRVNLTRVPAAVRCAAALRELGHPLAGLPLRLGRGERWIRAPYFQSGWLPRREHHVPEHPEVARILGDGRTLARVPGGEPTIVSTRQEERLITAAVEHWSSPGWAKIFELPGAVGFEELVPLGVNAFLPDAFVAETGLNGQRGSLGAVVGELFTSAYCDAAHSFGLRGGYGRLATWRSVAGLVRAPADASVHRVNELAARWRWLAFGITRRTPYWTDQELAVGALGPRGKVLSLLVSHDTD